MVSQEVRVIQEYASEATILVGDVGTREAVLTSVGKHTWLHLACHGHHNSVQPLLSHFSMHDGPITLLDLIKHDLPHAELAVLSACHSAKVSKLMPDEALHPAAVMLFAGYKSVIGRMWALDDSIGCALLAKFYRLMLGGSKGPKDCSMAGKGLEKALQDLDREGYDIPLAQRANVIHFGN